MKPNQVELSIVVPVYNEVQNVTPLVDAVRRAMESNDALNEPDAWELLLVDDGSTDGTHELGSELARDDSHVSLIPLARNFGQTAAMQAGFDAARGRVIVSMDGDLQNDPADIPKLLRKLDEGYDLVTGYRVDRQDTLITRKVPSWIANRIIAWLTGVSIRDNGCSLKAYRRELFDRVVLYSDMHRFIPAMAVAMAGARVAEIPVRHHARQAGRSKYGLSRIWKVLSDLLAIKMISSFRHRPLVMFGLGALVSAAVALVFAVLTLVSVPGGLRAGMAYTFVFPSVVLVWVTLAVYLLLLGLIAEVAIRGDRLSAAVPLPTVKEWT